MAVLYLTVQAWESCLGKLSWKPVLAFMSAVLSCPAFLSRQFCSGSLFLEGQLLSFLFLCPVLRVQFCLSCSIWVDLPVLVVLSWRNSLGSPVLLLPFLFFLSYSAVPCLYPVVAILFRMSCYSVPAVRPARPVLPVLLCLARSSSLVLAVLYTTLYWQSWPRYLALTVYPDIAVLPITVLPVLISTSPSDSPVLAIKACQLI